MMIGSDGGLVGPNPEGGTSCGSGVFWSVGVETMFRFGQSRSMVWRFCRVWGSIQSDLKNPPLGSGNPQKPGPLGGVGVGSGLEGDFDFIGP